MIEIKSKMKITYDDLALELFKLEYNYDYDDKVHHDLKESIYKRFFIIENDISNYFSIDCKNYKVSDRVDLVKMLYWLKHLYYSKNDMLDFARKIYQDSKVIDGERQFNDIVHEYSKRKPFMISSKELDNLEKIEIILKSNQDDVIAVIEKKIDKDEVGIIKKISQGTVTEGVIDDLNKWFCRYEIVYDYYDITTFATGVNLQMSMLYSETLDILRQCCLGNVKDNGKRFYFHFCVSRLTNTIMQSLQNYQINCNGKSLMELFYIKIKKIEISNILEHEKKVQSYLDEQSKLIGLEAYEAKHYSKSNIQKMSESIVTDRNNVSSSIIRRLQMEHKGLGKAIKDRYEGLFMNLEMTDAEIDILVLREIYYERESKKKQNIELMEIKKNVDLKTFNIIDIVKKIMRDESVTDEEDIYLRTLINRGVITEKYDVTDLLYIDSIDIMISDAVLSIYDCCDIYKIEELINHLFETIQGLMLCVLKNEK